MKDHKPMKPQLRPAQGPSRTVEKAGLGRDIQAKIGLHLRTMYDEVVKEGVPEHFANLIKQIDLSTNKEPRK